MPKIVDLNFVEEKEWIPTNIGKEIYKESIKQPVVTNTLLFYIQYTHK